MFLQAWVCQSFCPRGGGGCLHSHNAMRQAESLLSKADPSPSKDIPPPSQGRSPSPPPRPDAVNMWAVRVLLECILVKAK